MKIAAWQMPIEATGADDAFAALHVQVRRCEEAGVSVLCCPEAAIGGLADYAAEPEALGIATSPGEPPQERAKERRASSIRTVRLCVRRGHSPRK